VTLLCSIEGWWQNCSAREWLDDGTSGGDDDGRDVGTDDEVVGDRLICEK